MNIICYNRLKALKQYKFNHHILPPPHKIQKYEHKIQIIHNISNYNINDTHVLINLEAEQNIVDYEYLKYIHFKHLNNLYGYILQKGIKLIDLE